MLARIDFLASIEARIWQELQQAATRRGHEWRTMALATVQDGAAQARTVILREADAEARELIFFTDARSAKVTQMRAQPMGTLLCWSSRIGWQLRLGVGLEVQTSGLSVSSLWDRLKLTPAAQDYLSPLPPGSPLAPPPQHSRRQAELQHHFAVVTARVIEIDWLELHADGHRRAHLSAKGAHWLQP